MPAFAAVGARSDGTISAHRGGVNWKMGKLTGVEAVGRSLIPHPESLTEKAASFLRLFLTA
jgi:hypothetical protein